MDPLASYRTRAALAKRLAVASFARPKRADQASIGVDAKLIGKVRGPDVGPSPLTKRSCVAWMVEITPVVSTFLTLVLGDERVAAASTEPLWLDTPNGGAVRIDLQHAVCARGFVLVHPPHVRLQERGLVLDWVEARRILNESGVEITTPHIREAVFGADETLEVYGRVHRATEQDPEGAGYRDGGHVVTSLVGTAEAPLILFG